MIPSGRFREALEYLEARDAPCVVAAVQAGKLSFAGMSMADAKRMAADFSMRGVPATFEVTLDEDRFAWWLTEQRSAGTDLDWELLGEAP